MPSDLLKTWAQALAVVLCNRLAASLSRRGVCHIMLTGGRSAAMLYAAWAPRLAVADWQGTVHFYFVWRRALRIAQ